MTEVRYTLTVWITQSVERDEDPRDYLTSEVKRDLEKIVLKALRKLDGDADCEVFDAETLHSAEPEHDEAYERAAARARSNDFAETGGKDWT